MAKVLQKTIAEHVGVSQTSVSLVLNDPDTPRVARQTKERIFEYLRRHSPENWGSPSSRNLAFVAQSDALISHLYDFYYGGVFRAAEQTAREFGRQVFYKTYAGPEELRAIAADPGTAGLIHVNYIEAELLRELQRKLPVVAINSIHTLECDVVKTDLRSGARDEVHYLRRHGHERIAFVGRKNKLGEKPGQGEPLNERFSGYCEGLFAEDQPVRWGYVGMIDEKAGTLYPEEPHAREALEALLNLPQPPTAIVAFNDYIALGLMKAAREMGLQLPDDLSLVGCDNIDACQLFSPRLTTVQQKREDMGAAAVEILVERIERGQWDNPREVFCGTFLVERESVADLTGAQRPVTEEGLPIAR